MKKVLKNNIGGIIFYATIILTIICVNLRYEYLNNSNCDNDVNNIVAKN